MKTTLTYAIVLSVFAFVIGHFVLTDVQEGITRLMPAAESAVDVHLQKKQEELGRPLTDAERSEVTLAIKGITEYAKFWGTLICRLIFPLGVFLLTLIIGGLIVFFRRKSVPQPAA